ncbi:ribbon-helix-helix domain-containing protein [Aliarcobacter cryaerophilus]|uniref:ribbon-helix-helix domain-containing protein n=1 Tax=Aliarcobacter cryaerophilus TaxID=28198 RepID=UPI0021B24B55|nr:ribbon-helix-helix domain-containing protein [Aliarcobacter cryaerophilus]MCT7502009.1 ribbon-helix-helix domain-containing protein [Aliarcobacter cryaerophilus]
MLNTTQEITENHKNGRPKKFSKKLDISVNIYLSEGQLQAIDNKIKEIGFSVRQDYFRKLIRADIPNFDEL